MISNSICTLVKLRLMTRMQLQATRHANFGLRRSKAVGRDQVIT
jgi:hypothetical protein